MKAYDFITVLASHEIFYVDIDLDLVRRSIEVYDKKIIGSVMKMLANLLNSKEFYERFFQTDFISYIMEKSQDARFGEKGPFIVLFNSLLTKVENELNDAEFDMYQQSLEYIATELNDSYTPYAVRSVDHCLEIFLKNEMQKSFAISVDDIVGIDTIERFAKESSDDEICSQYRCILDKFVVVE
ncbi:hypothetical protein TVAG_128880 [Trichomonas vaginalis G3]|uniref:Uncharacterized protein n=1 Tax=Trichomonas vaginalis (strain ATCC PRA-98 / G3) TaxID=412133 RepID=A2E4D9_TRIV3|nr:hypothetical protein TVAGG3_0018660 [Trichomonas vaginalis G3]EAY12474.1 hypothetical protein TVAG_128880 [Trichomonas vaginalis G3]KAI5539537.1 hypothetical protein TVAGG3_0018660 [Trichomonas vaginalis G3]|eukprot:XP_001324697.1 hypothetical protein [Trichomonas vaginalis G3]